MNESFTQILCTYTESIISTAGGSAATLTHSFLDFASENARRKEAHGEEEEKKSRKRKYFADGCRDTATTPMTSWNSSSGSSRNEQRGKKNSKRHGIWENHVKTSATQCYNSGACMCVRACWANFYVSHSGIHVPRENRKKGRKRGTDSKKKVGKRTRWWNLMWCSWAVPCRSVDYDARYTIHI